MDLDIQPLSYADQMTLAETLGRASPGRTWWNQALTVASIKAINGRPTMKATHPSHIRAVLVEIGDEGYQQARAIFANFTGAGEPEAKFDIAELTAVERWDLAEACGEFFDITSWQGLATLAAMVRAKDGTALPMPKTAKEMKERVRFLGWSGIQAVSNYLTEKASAPDPEPKPGN